MELVSRSPSGNEYIQRLRVPTLELDQLANAKIFIILQASWKSLWPGWFCTSLNPTTAKDEDADVLRTLCEQIVDEQFGRHLDAWYPDVNKVDDNGRRRHFLRHEDASKGITEELEKAIEGLIYLRQIPFVK